MKKSFLFLMIISGLANAKYVSIINQEFNLYNKQDYEKTVVYSDWTNINSGYNCSVDIDESEVYSTIEFNQENTCDQDQTRTITTTKKYKTGLEETTTSTEVKTIKTTTNVLKIGTHLEASCREALFFDPNLSSGGYPLKLSDSLNVNAYCDMSDGGWTLVMSQTATGGLSSAYTDINPSNFMNLNSNFRWGNDKLSVIKPTVAWKFTDDTTTTYFNKSCNVNLNNYLDGTSNDCSVAYSDINFTSLSSERIIENGTRGIGQNNAGQYNSVRIYITVDFTTKNGIKYSVGDAWPSNSSVNKRVKLWFK